MGLDISLRLTRWSHRMVTSSPYTGLLVAALLSSCSTVLRIARLPGCWLGLIMELLPSVWLQRVTTFGWVTTEATTIAGSTRALTLTEITNFGSSLGTRWP